jgi:hypothetical protein
MVKLPGFTAENSLRGAMTHYRSATNRARSYRGTAIWPQQLLGGTALWPWWWRCPPGCFPTGNPWRPCFCWSTHLIDLPQ